MIRNQPLVEYKLNVKLLFIYLIISCFFIINLSGLCSKTVEKNVCKTYIETLFEEKLQLSKKRKSPQSLYLRGFVSYLPQHCLYFLPDPHGQGSFLPTFFDFLGLDIALVSSLSFVILFFDTSFLSKF